MSATSQNQPPSAAVSFSFCCLSLLLHLSYTAMLLHVIRMQLLLICTHWQLVEYYKLHRHINKSQACLIIVIIEQYVQICTTVDDKKCVDNLSEHNQFCSAILHFLICIHKIFINASLDSHLTVKPRYRLALVIVLPHSFLVRFILHFLLLVH